MRKVGINDITYSQFSKIILGSSIGVGVLSLPNDLAKISKQDAWISALIGGWYPLYIVILGIYISKNHPKENIYAISKRYFKKFIGGIFGIIFLSQFFIYSISICSGFSNILRVYIVDFLNAKKTVGVILFLTVLGCTKGLNVIGRVNEITYYFMMLLSFIPISAFREGSYLNVSPILYSGIGKILKATKESGFAYAGVEIMFLIYPFIDDSNKIKTSALKAVGIVIGIYTWFTFTTIYYLGPDIAQKPYWAFMILTESVDLPFINNFRFIFMFFWSLIIFKTVVNVYYSVGFSLNNYMPRISVKAFSFLLLPLVFYLSVKFGNEIQRRTLIGKIRPFYVYFNLFYLTILTIIIYFKRGKNHEKQKSC